MHEWWSPPPKGAHVCTPGSTNRHTHSALMAPPLKGAFGHSQAVRIMDRGVQPPVQGIIGMAVHQRRRGGLPPPPPKTKVTKVGET